jgi:glycosyltransferase involved in cell wall biosynthesis
VKILVANNAAPFVRGGAELLAERLVAELNQAGHRAELLRLPLGETPDEIADGLVAAATLDVVEVDRVIGLKFPAYLIPHRDVVVWLIHQFRQVYDLAPPAGGWHGDTALEPLAEAIRHADAAALERARRIYTISPEVADRLQRFNGIPATVLRHPPHADYAYSCKPAEAYLVAPGRISDGKRQALAARAMAHAGADARLVIAGAPDSRAALAGLEQAIAEAGVGDRVTLIPRFITDDEKLDLLARCTASVYLPVDEDTYGYVTYEAAMSGKPTVTCSDSGGALTLVADGVSGLVAEPEPAAVGAAFRRLLRDPAGAAAMGRKAASMAADLDLSWERVVQELTR